VHTLRGVNLTIDQGELAAMVSPPGSGKTTQVHLMATLDRPSPGAVRLDGHLCQVNRTGAPS
jgi:putative ABC transport system ATP-binding protein